MTHVNITPNTELTDLPNPIIYKSCVRSVLDWATNSLPWSMQSKNKMYYKTQVQDTHYYTITITPGHGTKNLGSDLVQ